MCKLFDFYFSHIIRGEDLALVLLFKRLFSLHYFGFSWTLIEFQLSHLLSFTENHSSFLCKVFDTYFSHIIWGGDTALVLLFGRLYVEIKTCHFISDILLQEEARWPHYCLCVFFSFYPFAGIVRTRVCKEFL